MNVLIWLKRDLRLADHPALTLAAGLGPVLPLYVVEPEYWQLPDTSARQWDMTAEALAGLRADLAALGVPLIVRVGGAVGVLERLCRQHRIGCIVSHEETGNLWTFARDRQVAAWARSAGIDWREVPQSAVVRRRVAQDGVMTAPPLPVPALTAVAGVEPGQIPSARALRMAEDRCPHRQRGGRDEALRLLDSFLTLRGEPYRSAMSAPLAAERACSRLSPHLALGVMSVREVAQAAQARLDGRPGGRWGGALASFQSRLAARDQFIQKLEDHPDIEARCLSPLAEGLRPRAPDPVRLAAWAAGETGLPFVDACMRYLQATGWLNFHMRAMLMAVASYHLWLDWRATGAVLARAFTDYEPGIHWPQVQMQSGVAGTGTPRICNPVKQGLEHDPTGAFTRRWLPELAAVPDRFLQEPWKWPGFAAIAGRRYPEPLIDPNAAARAARDAIWSLRRREGVRETVMPLLESGRSLRRTAPLRAPSAQLVLDL